MRRACHLTFVVSAAAALTLAAQAAEPPPIAASPSANVPPTATRADPGPEIWYGHQTLIADGLSFAAGGIALVLAIENPPHQRDPAGALTALMFTGYLLGAPMIHGIHGHGLRALGSLGIRLGLPTAGLLVGALIACTGHYCVGNSNELNLPEASPVPIYLGLGLGGLGAIAIDAFHSAYDEPESPSGARFLLIPTGQGLALAGRF